MPRTITVAQTKGGVGKTTISMMLAAALTALGKKVVVVDADKQGSATQWSLEAGEELQFSVESAASPALLSSTLTRLSKSSADYVIIDTPPGSNTIIKSAAAHSELILLPTGVSPLDMSRTQATLDAFSAWDAPIAVVLTNVNKRENLFEIAQNSLTSQAQAAVADTIIPSRTATRRAGNTAPRIKTQPYKEWIDLAYEVEEAFQEN